MDTIKNEFVFDKKLLLDLKLSASSAFQLCVRALNFVRSPSHKAGPGNSGESHYGQPKFKLEQSASLP